MAAQHRKTNPSVNTPVLDVDQLSDNYDGDEEDDATNDYKVERLVGYKHENGRDLFQVRWEGFPSDEDTWEPSDNLPGFEQDMNILKRNASQPQSSDPKDTIATVHPNKSDASDTEQDRNNKGDRNDDEDQEIDEDDEKLATISTSHHTDELSHPKSSTMLLPQLSTPHKRKETNTTGNKRNAGRGNARGSKTDGGRGRKRTKLSNAYTAETSPGSDSPASSPAGAAPAQYRHHHVSKEAPSIIELTPSNQLAPPLPHKPDAPILLDQTELRRIVREEIASCANLQALKTPPAPIVHHSLGTGGEPKVLHVGAAPTKAKPGPWTLLQYPGGEEIYLPCERAKTTHTVALVDYLLERIRFTSERETAE